MMISAAFPTPRFLHAAGLLLGLGAMMASAQSAAARDLAPLVPETTTLGDLSAMTYYTVERDGYRVVTTFQMEGPAGITPFRVVSTVLPGQKTVISVPRAAGLKPLALEIVRDGDRLTVIAPSQGPTASAQVN